MKYISAGKYTIYFPFFAVCLHCCYAIAYKIHASEIYFIRRFSLRICHLAFDWNETVVIEMSNAERNWRNCEEYILQHIGNKYCAGVCRTLNCIFKQSWNNQWTRDSEEDEKKNHWFLNSMNEMALFSVQYNSHK